MGPGSWGVGRRGKNLVRKHTNRFQGAIPTPPDPGSAFRGSLAGMTAGILGRPSTYTPELGERIAALYADGVDFHEMSARDSDLPERQAIRKWRRDFPDFASMLTRARADRADVMAAETLALADEPLDLRLDGKLASAGVQRQNARVGTRRWLAGCLDRATYGDAPPTVAVQVNANVELGAILPARPMQADRGEPSAP